MHDMRHYKKIAFDLDGTLVDGVASAEIAAFIQAHPEKTYFIVTFRTPDQCRDIEAELQNVGLSLSNFQKLVPMPRTLAVEFEADQRQRRAARLPPIGSVEHMLPGEFRFAHWKGFICSKLGATVLVDDMPELSEPGCRRHHIALEHPKVFAGADAEVA